MPTSYKAVPASYKAVPASYKPVPASYKAVTELTKLNSADFFETNLLQQTAKSNRNMNSIHAKNIDILFDAINTHEH